MIVSSIVGAISSVASEFITDKDKLNEFETKLELGRQDIEKIALQNQGKQLEVNKAEAQHRSVFVAGWRPFCGWACTVGVVLPAIFPYIAYLIGLIAGIDLPELPVVDGYLLSTLLGGILGIGGARSVEKFKGIAK